VAAEDKKSEEELKDQEVPKDEITDTSGEKEATTVDDQNTVEEKEESKITELEDKVSGLEDRYLRAEAEIKNIQARNAKERAALLKYDGQQLAHDLLPVVDNIERALDSKVDDDQNQALKKGIELVLQHLNEALTKNGIEEIEATGVKFDPQLHQAVQTVPATDEVPADHVAQVLQKGYKLKDRVLRPAMVAVAQ